MSLSLAAAEKLVVVSNGIDQKKKPKTYPKVSVRLSHELNEGVKTIIANSTDITSPSQAIRQALVVYITLMEQTKQGNIGGVKMASGEFIPLFESEGDNSVST